MDLDLDTSITATLLCRMLWGVNASVDVTCPINGSLLLRDEGDGAIGMVVGVIVGTAPTTIRYNCTPGPTREQSFQGPENAVIVRLAKI